ncbi:MAG: hypothetical protein AB7U79_00560 [Candidatus Izemoplasmatales bacterium]
MKQEDFIAGLKEFGIIDEYGLYARVNIIYSETAQVISAMVSNYNSQGTPGVVGVFNDFLVLYEFATFSPKPKTEIFRVPLTQVEFVSLKPTIFNISKILRIKVEGRKVKLVAPGKFKNALETIANKIQR